MDASKFLILTDAELLAQCEVHTYRASGPGGQKRNKTSSAVRLHHQPTRLIAQAEENRSQHINKTKALKRLRLTLATEMLGPIDMESYQPSHQLAQTLRDNRMELSLRQENALLVINELLSLLDSSRGQVRTAAEKIGVSTANLVKTFELDVHVWRKVNQIRQQYQLKPLNSDP